jgi:hypothetical protein
LKWGFFAIVQNDSHLFVILNAVKNLDKIKNVGPFISFRVTTEVGFTAVQGVLHLGLLMFDESLETKPAR